MRLPILTIIFASYVLLTSCSETAKKPSTPLETFQTYTKAIKAKDTTAMKLLLSSETIKMHEQEAKSQGTTVDEIVRRETLFNESQTRVEYRNERIDGQTATLEVRNSSNNWEIVPFVFENDQWKIDKKGYADRISREIEEDMRKAEEEMNRGRIDMNDLSQPDTNSNSGNTKESIPY
jgi:hypothetical protein